MLVVKQWEFFVVLFASYFRDYSTVETGKIKIHCLFSWNGTCSCYTSVTCFLPSIVRPDYALELLEVLRDRDMWRALE